MLIESKDKGYGCREIGEIFTVWNDRSLHESLMHNLT